MISPDFNAGGALMALLGGALIGLAATSLQRSHGMTAGISGILSQGLLGPSHRARQTAQRWFLVGLLAAGFLGQFLLPSSFSQVEPRGVLLNVASGIIVGFGTRLGSGCTSGHGVCGLSRGAPRSIAATLTFIGTGALTVAILRWFRGGHS